MATIEAGPGGGADPGVVVSVGADVDVGRARRAAIKQAHALGFDRYACAAVAISVTELGTNLVRYAHGGEIRIRSVSAEGRKGIEVEACDRGPGIPDVARAMEDGFSTSGSMGSGLPGVRRLMDEFSIQSRVGEGTTIVARKWR